MCTTKAKAVYTGLYTYSNGFVTAWKKQQLSLGGEIFEIFKLFKTETAPHPSYHDVTTVGYYYAVIIVSH